MVNIEKTFNSQQSLIQSYSGTDISVLFSMPPFFSIGNKLPRKLSAEIHTLTISSAASLLPVRAVGEAKARAYTKGARTFAGTMIFTVLDKDPFQEIFALDALNGSTLQDGLWHIDQMPPFDAVITASNEAGLSAVQLISNIVFSNWGTTYSVDDMYTESTYTYMAEHVSPLIRNPTADSFAQALRSLVSRPRTPDDITLEVLAERAGGPYAGSQSFSSSDGQGSSQEFSEQLGPNQIWLMGALNDPVLLNSLTEDLFGGI